MLKGEENLPYWVDMEIVDTERSNKNRLRITHVEGMRRMMERRLQSNHQGKGLS